jgi:hypothetical protein
VEQFHVEPIRGQASDLGDAVLLFEAEHEFITRIEGII